MRRWLVLAAVVSFLIGFAVVSAIARALLLEIREVGRGWINFCR